MRIVNVAERPDLVETVARWQFDTWGQREPGSSLAAWVADLAQRAAYPHGIPATFVALEEEEPLGCASVVEEDAQTFRASPRQRGLTPWLASVYVRPEMRERGVASGLVRHIAAHVAAQGVARCYLFTESARGLYEKLGWWVIGTDWYAGGEMTIMAIDLTPDGGTRRGSLGKRAR